MVGATLYGTAHNSDRRGLVCRLSHLNLAGSCLEPIAVPAVQPSMRRVGDTERVLLKYYANWGGNSAKLSHPESPKPPQILLEW